MTSNSDILSINRIFEIAATMREYQAKHNVKGQCMTNAQYLFDIIKINTGVKITVKNVIAIGYNPVNDQTVCIGGHLVIVFDNDDEENVIDPSYEVFSLTDKRYYDNVRDFMNDIKSKDRSNLKDDIKECIGKFLRLDPIAERMNNGEFMIADKEYYNKQGDYVEDKIGLTRI